MGSWEQLSPQQLTALILGVTGIAGLTGIVITALVQSEKRKIELAQIHAESQRDMLARGMSADDIAKLSPVMMSVDASADSLYHKVGPAMCDVAVLRSDGAWHHALIVDSRGDSFQVHFIGEDVSSNAWVDRDKVRFPASVAFEKNESSEYPEMRYAQPATVAVDGDWLPAYLVMRVDRCFVHVIGTDWDDNLWVDEASVRFPSGAQIGHAKPTKPFFAEL